MTLKHFENWRRRDI